MSILWMSCLKFMAYSFSYSFILMKHLAIARSSSDVLVSNTVRQNILHLFSDGLVFSLKTKTFFSKMFWICPPMV